MNLKSRSKELKPAPARAFNPAGRLGTLGALMLSLAAIHSLIPAYSAEGAKDLFYRQISNQSQILNTGMQYWIELKRQGKQRRVSNKFAFKTGDSIRIHVTSNTDAFAYIVLKEGSAGEQSVLFPDPNYRDNNKLKSGVDYSLPQDGAMTFDKNPGTERLILLLSRTPIDAHKYLNDKNKAHVVIAAHRDGAKDLVPGTVVLAYANDDGSIGTLKDEGTLANNSASGSANKSNHSSTPAATTAAEKDDNNSVTTLVQKDPTQILAVDLALMHEP